jgi:AraC family ethanolamine operon transcriptional activator
MQLSSSYTRHTYSGFEPSQAFDVIYGGRFEHRLLSGRCATMEHQRLVVGDVRLETGSYDFPVVAQGNMPTDAVCVGFVAGGSEQTRYNTLSIDEDEIQVYPRSADLLYDARGASRWITLTVSDDKLQQVALVRTGRPLELPTKSAASVRLMHGGRFLLTRLADDAMALARSLEPIGGIAPDLADAMSGSLLAGYVDALFRAGADFHVSKSTAAERHYLLILACERLVTSGQDTNIAIAEIAQRSGYSRRALELIFRQSVGMSPGRWFRNVRLNGALRDLIMPTETCSVSEIAARWGFRHFSRFSQQYRAVYGESPSQTLNRARG